MKKKNRAAFFCFVLCVSALVISAPCFAGETAAQGASLFGKGKLTSAEMAKMLVSSNPDIDSGFARSFADLYIHEAELAGVNHDIAFTQLCRATNYLKFTTAEARAANNFAAADYSGKSKRYPTILMGVRAQIHSVVETAQR